MASLAQLCTFDMNEWINHIRTDMNVVLDDRTRLCMFYSQDPREIGLFVDGHRVATFREEGAPIRHEPNIAAGVPEYPDHAEVSEARIAEASASFAS
ncbi:hypothetical protein [Chachezhania antarctica]|uniref:hypothetical protein n=1 Tax=Chachezhania antarctica TaxID=2340860 RepID=UPI000EAF4CE2|nr:hypothetical protein [Chachezhania antarctica]